MRKIISILFLLQSLLFTSCTEEQVETVGKIATLTLLYSAVYSHSEYGTFYYRTKSCNGSYQYYSNGSSVSVYCRYYSSPSGYGSGYYLTTYNRYSSIMVYQ